MKSDSATNIKNNFSSYIDRVKRGETVLVLEYGRPVAQIVKPEIFPGDETNLSSLEREGMVSLPLKPLVSAEDFLAQRPKLGVGKSLLSTLLQEREESL